MNIIVMKPAIKHSTQTVVDQYNDLLWCKLLIPISDWNSFNEWLKNHDMEVI